MLYWLRSANGFDDSGGAGLNARIRLSGEISHTAAIEALYEAVLGESCEVDDVVYTDEAFLYGKKRSILRL